ncbi:effector-associated domain 2-containing protein [Nonomuraea recticatena]|uniref:effector-associated domain 2-containing protein n=1 Tax=Nonomuraea recticatena TaxID=46178 RepID=UPI0036161D4F
MERVSSLQTPQDRDEVLRLLGPPVEGLVKRDTRTRHALLSLASVCGTYPTGLADLLEVLERLEGPDSSPYALWRRRSSTTAPDRRSRTRRRVRRRRRRPIRRG